MILRSPIQIDIPSWLPNHPWHPSVVYVKEGWNGHTYWMAQTPLPPRLIAPYLDRWELPCIHYSDDGLSWKSINTNPIDDISNHQLEGHGYMSDPHLLLKDGVLYCYYRMMDNHDQQTTILRKYSTDGENWSEREIVCSVQSKEREIISPAIAWSGEKFRMYYVDDTYTNLHRGVHYCESDDGLHFDSPQPVILEHSENETVPWHIDVQKIEDIWMMVIQDVDRNKVELWESTDGKTFQKRSLIQCVSSRRGDFFSKQLYRSCLVSASEDRNNLKVYLSARNDRSRYIGLMESADGYSWNWVDCREGVAYWQFVCKIVKEEISALYHRLGKYIRKRI